MNILITYWFYKKKMGIVYIPKLNKEELRNLVFLKDKVYLGIEGN